jgi:membrane-associated protease RseP (regulator of RpoE activity)
VCTRNLDGKQVQFGTTGYTMDRIFVLYDRTSDSIWYPLGDRTFDAVAGDRRGDSIPFLDKPSPQPLADWLAQHPDSQILLPSAEDVEMLERFANMPYLGVQLGEGEDGLSIDGVMDDTPAQQAGLLAGDVIRSIDGQTIKNRDDLGEVMGEHAPGDVVEIVILRSGRERTMEVTLGSR